MAKLNSNMWCITLTRTRLLILQIFSHIGCLCIVITNGPAHCLKGELSGLDLIVHLRNYRLLSHILIKPDLAIGEIGSLTIANDDLEQLMAFLMANNYH